MLRLISKEIRGKQIKYSRISHYALHTAALILTISCQLVSDDATDILPHTILKTRVTNLPSAPPPPNPGIHFGLQ